MLTVKVLGRYEIQSDSRPVELPTQSARTLLAYLLLNAGVAHRRTRLAGLFWPDSPESNARSNLRHTLWRIRKAIGGDYLLSDNTSVTYNAGADYWFDADIVLRASVENASLADLMDAVSAYGGDLLPGVYNDWVILERERLRTVLDRQAERLLEALMRSGRWEELVEWGERWLSLGAAPESAYRALMTAHAELGNLVNVATVYRRCVDVLRNDVDVEPSQETQALYARLSLGERPTATALAALDKDAARFASPRSSSACPPAFLDEDVEPPQLEPDLFAGRERELSILERFLDSALAGHGQVVFVTGSAGRGKTTLLREFERRSQALSHDLLVLSGNCNAYAGVGDPYLPFRDILKMLTGDVDAKWLSGAVTRQHAQRLWDVVPEASQAILDSGPDLIDTFVPGTALLERASLVASAGEEWMARLHRLIASRERRAADLEQSYLFEQYASVLARLSAQQPLLVTLDDLQWADTGSISLLFHLGRRIAGMRILVVGAYRPEETALGWDGSRHPLQKVISEFSRLFGANSVDLAYENEREGRRFVEILLNKQPNELDERFLDSLFRQTGGHPLFTVELLRAMQARGDLIQDADRRWVQGGSLDWDVLPARVEAVIQERIGRLDARLYGILSAASVEGEDFTAEVVARVQGLSRLETVRLLSQELGKRHRLVRESEETRVGDRLLSRYRFSHILYQRYLQDEMDGGERRQLHAEIVHVLEELYEGHSDEIAARLYRHAAAAGMREKAINYARVAARRASDVYAYDEAVQHLQSALDLLEEGAQNRTRMSLVESQADMHALLGNRTRAPALYQHALALWSQLSDEDEIARIRLRRKFLTAAIEMHWNEFEELEAQAQAVNDTRFFLEECLALPHDAFPMLERVHILTVLAEDSVIGLRQPLDLDRAERYAKAAVELAEKLDVPVELSDALRTLSSVAFTRGLLLQHREISVRRLKISEDVRFSDVRKKIRVLEDVFNGQVMAGNYGRALEVLAESERLAEQIGAAGWLVNIYGTQVRCLYRLDRWDEVLGIQSKCRLLEQRHSAEQLGMTCIVHSFSSAVLAARGDSNRSKALREEAYSIMVRGSGGSPASWGRNAHY